MMFKTLSRRPAALMLLVLAVLLSSAADAQRRKKKPVAKIKTIYEIDTLVAPIPRNRMLFHDNYEKALRGMDAIDGKVDNIVYVGDDTLASAVATQTLHAAKHIDTMIENLPFTDKQIETQTKIAYLRAATNTIRKYDLKTDPFQFRKVVTNLRDMIIAKQEGKLDAFVRENANKQSLYNIELVGDNPELRGIVYRAVGNEEPRMMLQRLSDYATEPFACDIIAAAARTAPNDVYTFASSTNYKLSNAVRRCSDPLVQAIVRISSESKAPLKAMSFISDIYNKRLTIAEIDKITADEDLFYKNLVRLRLQGDSLGGATYTDELQYRGLKYVTRINELHESTDLVRFKAIEKLSPEELYYMMVYGQDQIYTSSFIGSFNRMMERMKPVTGDELLDKVRYDHFRTFIRMCAGYSKLSEFLATMKPDEKTAVMRDFVSGLENGKPEELEDAVDVADAYGSVEDSSLKDFLRGEIVSNYKRVSDARNTKGTIVYGLLATLSQTNSSDELSNSLRLPPIDRMPNKNLLSDSGVVYEQVFFYGDEDGKMSYQSYMENFRDGKWKVATGPQWVTITSTSGKPVTIFANLPLNYEEGKDEEAQKALKQYLENNNIRPTVIVHRGHSYHLSSTIDNMEKPNRIIILGSCGGYHNLGKVLDRAPDAQLVSTKQTGTMLANNAICKAMNAHLLAGDDINWIQLWNEVGGTFKGKGKAEKDFLEYVPPHRNLGAIFIKAYRRMMNEQEADAEG
jgi:hypothetical protein